MAEPELTLDVLLSDDAFGRRPEAPAWRSGRAELSYLWDAGDGTAFWLMNARSGDRRALLGPGALAEAGLEEVDAYHWDPTGRRVLFEAGGALHLLEVGSGGLRRLAAGEGVSDPKFSPDGEAIAFVREADLFRFRLADDRPQRLTTGGEPGVVFNGTTDWVYWEEIWDRSSNGFWWSPDGRKIAYYHFDDHEVREYPLLDADPLYPEIERQRYPKAGETLPWVEVRVLDLETGSSQRLDTGDDRDVYLARVIWHPDGEKVAIERLDREQDRLDLLLCRAGDGACSLLWREEHPTWVNLGDGPRFLADGRFLRSSEREGWRRLYLHAADGRELRAVTPEGWALTSLDAVDAEAGWLVFTGHRTEGLGAAERHVLRVELESGEHRRLTEEAGWHDARVAASGHWVDGWSNADTPPRLSVRGPDGAVLHELPYVPPAGFDPEQLSKWRIFTIAGPEGSRLPARLLEPAGFDPARRYPVIVYHYGGPASQVVEDRWRARRRRELWHKMMAERGYAVFEVDNQASRFFGKAGEDRLHRRFGELELAGQLAAVEHLRGLPWVDAERIGLWGWSGGGSNTLYSLLSQPGVWRAGIAGAPVTDWRLYDAIWMERYLDHPQDNPEGYRDSSPITYAARLADPLLVIHGTGDDNVHPQNTTRLVSAFIEAGVPFEMALYPNQRHSLETFDAAHQRHVFERMTAFFDRHLGGGR